MSVLEACGPHGVCEPQQLLTASVSSSLQHPILKRLTRMMDSAGEETDADSESLELALLDVELTKYAAHEGIHIPAASPSTSAGGSSAKQQLSVSLVSPRRQQHHSKTKPMQPGTVLQLVQQQSKFLDVLQSMIDKNVGLEKPHQHQTRSSASTAVQAAAAADPRAAAGAGDAAVSTLAGGAEQAGQEQLGVLQVQYERQLADNHALKKRCLKVQKAMLKHMQAARAQAAAAEAACEEARRREQQASTTNATLQAQLTQQQHMLEAQQQQLSGMQEQLMQLKDLHKKKLTRYKTQLQQQYESQLAAATTAYTQELSLVHAVQLSAGERFTSGGGASSCSDSGPTPRQLSKKPRQSSAAGAAPGSTTQSLLAGVPAAAGTSRRAGSGSGRISGNGSSLGGKSSAHGSSHGGSSKPVLQAAGQAAPADAGLGVSVVSGAMTAGAARHSSSGHQGGLTDAEVAGGSAAHAGCMASAAAAAGSSAVGNRNRRPSLPLVADASSLLLQQLSISEHLPDPHFATMQPQELQDQQQPKKQPGQRQQAGGGGSQRGAPDTPRRATHNGSAARQRPAAALDSRSARSRTSPGVHDEATPEAAAAAPPPTADAAGTDAAAAAAVAAAAASPLVAEASEMLSGGGPALAVDGSVAVAVAQQLQSHLLLLLAQQLAEHLPPELADIDPNAILSLQQAVAGQMEQQQGQVQEEEEEGQQEEGEDREGEEDGEEGEESGDSAEQQAQVLLQGQQQQGLRQQRQHGAGVEVNVPDEVLHYAQQYHTGGEGASRPPTATPSVLQHQRQQQVPEAAAQLAQHFVAGGEGTSRPLTAPSSDRSRAIMQQQQPRASSPSGRGGRQAGTRNEHPAVPSNIPVES